MNTQVTYLFDPLCGWCYGASPLIQLLGQQAHIQLTLAPTGLFSGGGRTMDAAFADFAWSIDLRIAKLTGQRFTEDYRSQVLGRLGTRFDSANATLALTAVALSAPKSELETLKVLQEARYVQGLDTCDMPVIQELLLHLGLDQAARLLIANDAELASANTTRLRNARSLMQSVGAQGVPALVVSTDKGDRLLSGNALFGGIDNLIQQIALAA